MACNSLPKNRGGWGNVGTQPEVRSVPLGDSDVSPWRRELHSIYQCQLNKSIECEREGMTLHRTLKTRRICLILAIFVLVFIVSITFWPNEFKNQHTIFHNLSPYPQNRMLDCESSLCSSKYTPIKPPPHNNIRCPQKPIVTVRQIGRLGNQMWEYISVWAAAKKTGREPYVPSCLIQELGKIFRNITVSPLSYLAYCNVEKYPVEVTVDKLDKSNGSILLPDFVQLPMYIAPLRREIRQIFQFQKSIADESQRLLHFVSRGVKKITYVGVHVRRTDYIQFLKKKYNASPAKPDYFLKQMDVFRTKYKPVKFVVVSDDPVWCERELRGDDVVVMRNNSPVQDLAIMAACNHSIIDYGTYGVWGAILAGGDTRVYNLQNGGAFTLARFLPNWHIVT